MAKKRDLTGHPCKDLSTPARKVFENIVEETEVRFETKNPPKTISDLENAGLIFVRGYDYDWRASANIDAWDDYCAWLDKLATVVRFISSTDEDES